MSPEERVVLREAAGGQTSADIQRPTASVADHRPE